MLDSLWEMLFYSRFSEKIRCPIIKLSKVIGQEGSNLSSLLAANRMHWSNVFQIPEFLQKRLDTGGFEPNCVDYEIS